MTRTMRTVAASTSPRAATIEVARWGLATLAVLSTASLLLGCGVDGSRSESDESTTAVADGLVATTDDGKQVRFDKARAACGPSESHPDVQVLRVSAEMRGAQLSGELVLAEVEGGESFNLPLDAGDEEQGPTNAVIFLAIEPGIEASSEEEGASGTMRVVQASCDPVVAELEIDGVLGSEYSDGQNVAIHGRLQASGSGG